MADCRSHWIWLVLASHKGIILLIACLSLSHFETELLTAQKGFCMFRPVNQTYDQEGRIDVHCTVNISSRIDMYSYSDIWPGELAKNMTWIDVQRDLVWHHWLLTQFQKKHPKGWKKRYTRQITLFSHLNTVWVQSKLIKGKILETHYKHQRWPYKSTAAYHEAPSIGK